MIGQVVGIIQLKHSPGYEIVMRMATGKIDTFSPHGLLPIRSEELAKVSRQLMLSL
ncbi:MAG: hypothetical protein J0H59_00185 [Comamonadaceae bacterium]|nr:hypothetical protein [Comamonadaceae bacterium]